VQCVLTQCLTSGVHPTIPPVFSRGSLSFSLTERLRLDYARQWNADDTDQTDRSRIETFIEMKIRVDPSNPLDPRSIPTLSIYD